MKIGGDFSIIFPLFVSVKGSEFQAFYETAIFPLILCPPYPLKLNSSLPLNLLNRFERKWVRQSDFYIF